ncbi:MAG: type IV pilus assembly protein PilM [Candidatus Caldarchaeum sp.]
MPFSLFAKEHLVGIDIGHSTIKLAQVEKRNQHLHIVSAYSLPTPSDAITEGMVKKPDAVASVIRRGLREGHISASGAVIGVSGSPVIVRSAQLPKMAETQLKKSIRYEASRYVPSSVEDSYVECEIVGPVGENQMEVLIVACPKDMVESRVNAVESAGLEVEIVDIDAFALHRALIQASQNSQWAEKTVAIVDVGGEGSHVSIIDEDTFALTRFIPIGGKLLTNALANYFKVSDADAEQGKRELDLSILLTSEGPMENAPLRVIQPLMDELVREVRRSINYFHSQSTDKGQERRVSEIILAGGASQMKGFAQYLSHKLAIPVNRPSLLENSRFVMSASVHGGDTILYATAIGLAMRRIEKDLLAA